MAVVVFTAGALLTLYVLFGYPLLLAALSRWLGKPVARQWIPRTVSIVIPVHNGAEWVEQKLHTIAELDYPHELINVIFVDDGSTDGTGALLARLSPPGTTIVSAPRGGKAAALNAGIARATGEILFLTDIRQRLDPGSLRTLVECFADPCVGVVSGELIILSGETHEQMHIGLYWRYEKWLRKRLSRLDSVAGATGCIYAMRRQLATPLPANTLVDDVHLPLAAFAKGYRIIFDEQARAFDYPTSLSTEFRRKVRTQAGVWQTIAAFPGLLLPGRRMSLHFLSHKVGRLVLPYVLLAVAISTLFLPAPFQWLFGLPQAAFYGLAVLDRWIPQESPLKRATSMIRTFVVLMAAALCAPFFLMLNGGRGWTATEVHAGGRLPR